MRLNNMQRERIAELMTRARRRYLSNEVPIGGTQHAGRSARFATMLDVFVALLDDDEQFNTQSVEEQLDERCFDATEGMPEPVPGQYHPDDNRLRARRNLAERDAIVAWLEQRGI